MGKESWMNVELYAEMSEIKGMFERTWTMAEWCGIGQKELVLEP